MGDDHPLGAGGGNRPLQARPVGVVAQHKAPVHALAAARAAQQHPAAGKAVAEIAQLARPGAGVHGGRRDHQRTGQPFFVRQIAQRGGLGQRHAGRPVGGVERGHRTVHHDRADAGIHPGQQPLRLAKAVGQQQAGPAGGGVAPPPGVDLRKHLGLRLPAVDGQAEGGFGDETIAAHRLERRTGGVALIDGRQVVIARRHPDPAAVRQPHLGRAQHMAGGVQADGHAVVLHGLAVGQPLQRQVGTQPAAQHALADGGGQHVAVAGARMVGMGVGDHRPGHGPPGVDVEIAGRAVQALRAVDHQIVHRACQFNTYRLGRPGARTSTPSRPQSRAAAPTTSPRPRAGAAPLATPPSRPRCAPPGQRQTARPAR